MKTICLDYDGTFTEFPDLMYLIINYCKKNNIRIILCTMRYESETDDGLKKIRELIPIYFSSRQPKADFLLKTYNIAPDIWIDDQPNFIYNHG